MLTEAVPKQELQISSVAEAELTKQQYRVIGKYKHSAVKVCGWTKKMIKGEGGCYKLTFYGIMSNQCMQMTTSMSCANRCTFCWRGYKAPVAKDWTWGVDDPVMMLEESLKQHQKLLSGMGGHPNMVKKAHQDSKTVKHVALSLTGEPITYPRINEIIGEFNKLGISTFLVTNAQYPEQIRDLNPVTQLYISLDAPNKKLLKEIDKPLFKDYWERLIKSLEYMAQKPQRTTIRLTAVMGENMVDPKEYADMIKKGDPDFIEVKGYMFVGASRQRLSINNMPLHEQVVEYAKQLEAVMPEYEIVVDHPVSRAVMLAKKKFKIDGVWHTWLDFPKYHELVLSGKPFTSMDYIKKTPKVGLSGQKTNMKNKEEREL